MGAINSELPAYDYYLFYLAINGVIWEEYNNQIPRFQVKIRKVNHSNKLVQLETILCGNDMVILTTIRIFFFNLRKMETWI